VCISAVEIPQGLKYGWVLRRKFPAFRTEGIERNFPRWVSCACFLEENEKNPWQEKRGSRLGADVGFASLSQLFFRAQDQLPDMREKEETRKRGKGHLMKLLTYRKQSRGPLCLFVW
jgi:hypothetical protein